jgi:hypothetical protein
MQRNIALNALQFQEAQQRSRKKELTRFDFRHYLHYYVGLLEVSTMMSQNHSSEKRLAIFYHSPPGAQICDTQIANEVNRIKAFCRQCNLKPVQTYIDRSELGTLYKTMIDYTNDPENDVVGFICYTAGTNLAGFGGINIIPTSDESDSEKNSKFLGGIPFGYSAVNGELVVDTDKAAIVNEIFRKKATGDSLQSIADFLNSKGVPSARGGDWKKQSVSFILKNMAYVGEYRYSETNEEKTTSVKIPKIVSRQLFNKANGF